MLSQWITCGWGKIHFKSLKICLTQVISAVVWARALYSASVELLDTKVCFFDCHEIGFSPRKKNETRYWSSSIKVSNPIKIRESFEVYMWLWGINYALLHCTLKIPKNPFYRTKMNPSWWMHVLTYCIHSKCNIQSCKSKILKDPTILLYELGSGSNYPSVISIWLCGLHGVLARFHTSLMKQVLYVFRLIYKNVSIWFILNL